MTPTSAAIADTATAPPLAPIVPGLPVLGSVFPLARDNLAFFTAMYRAHGPHYRVRVPGRVLTVLAGPEANLLLSRDDGLLRSRETWQPFIEQFGARRNVLSLDGEPHAQLRKMMKRTHTRSMAGPHLDMLHDVVRQAALRLPVGRRLRVIDTLRPMISEQLGRLLARRSGRDLTQELTRVNREVTNVFVVKSRPPFTLRLPRFRRGLERVLALGADVLQEHRTASPDPVSPDFIDDLLAAVAENPDLLGEGDLRFAAVGPFVAGLDTVANACSFLLYELLARDELRARVVAEADALFSGGALALDRLRALRTLTLALMETLRLHPVAPAIMRNAARDFTFAGFRVPEGEPLLIATAVSHFLPRFWTAPAEFDPARFEPPRNEHRQAGAYAPYGLGPHTCLGASLAEVQVVLLVATLLHTVELRLSPPGYRLRKINSPGPTPEKAFRFEVVRVRLPAP